MTQQERTAKANIQRWKASTDTSLSDVYKTNSTAKDRAWKYCQELCEKYNGTGLKVVSHNQMIFTAGFQFVDKDTGVLRYMHITPSYDTAVDMD